MAYSETLDQSYNQNRKRLINLEQDHHAVLQAIGELHGRGLVALAYVGFFNNIVDGDIFASKIFHS